MSFASFHPPLPSLRQPGLFVTATDTNVGKTVITCAIAAAIRRQSPSSRLGVCKPFASGCQSTREGLVSDDALALAHFSNCRQPLHIINPIRFQHPLAPAVASQLHQQPVSWPTLAQALSTLDQSSDLLLFEGVGGLMVPLDPLHPSFTLLHLIRLLDYPVVLVVRATLGTLNHTMLSVHALTHMGCRIAGLIINHYDPDSSRLHPHDDMAITTNRIWLAQMTNLPILAFVPPCPSANLAPHQGIIPDDILQPLTNTYWPDLAASPRLRRPDPNISSHDRFTPDKL